MSCKGAEAIESCTGLDSEWRSLSAAQGRDGGPRPDRPASSFTRKCGSEVGQVHHVVRDLKEVTVRWGRLS